MSLSLYTLQTFLISKEEISYLCHLLNAVHPDVLFDARNKNYSV